MHAIDKLAEFLRDARAGIAFTGAGISTESGIPDFRSPGGVWSRNQPIMYDEFLRSRDARERYWHQRIEIYQDFARAEPNDGHTCVARLEQRGVLAGVITQNIDGLHQLAGSKRILELHGTARIVACVACGKEWSPEAVHAMIEAGDAAPDCDVCGSPLKSKTISFGQAMPREVMREAHELSVKSDVFLAMGSSLVVQPAASLPLAAQEAGATLVIINRTETPLDEIADLVIREPIGETMRSALDLLDRERGAEPGAAPHPSDEDRRMSQ